MQRAGVRHRDERAGIRSRDDEHPLARIAGTIVGQTRDRSEPLLALGTDTDAGGRAVRPDRYRTTQMLAEHPDILLVDDTWTSKQRDVAWKLASVRKAFDSLVAPILADARLAREAAPPMAVSSADVTLIVERVISDVAAGPAEFITPPGYAHLSLALVDAVYSIRSRYSAVERVVAAYGRASATSCQPLAARSDPGFSEHGLDHFLTCARMHDGEALADLLFAGSRSRTLPPAR
jgi:hypothetical protein